MTRKQSGLRIIELVCIWTVRNLGDHLDQFLNFVDTESDLEEEKMLN